MMKFEEYMYNSYCTVAKCALCLVFSTEEIQMRESCMANEKPPKYNGISMTEVSSEPHLTCATTCEQVQGFHAIFPQILQMR